MKILERKREKKEWDVQIEKVWENFGERSEKEIKRDQNKSNRERKILKSLFLEFRK